MVNVGFFIFVLHDSPEPGGKRRKRRRGDNELRTRDQRGVMYLSFT